MWVVFILLLMHLIMDRFIPLSLLSPVTVLKRDTHQLTSINHSQTLKRSVNASPSLPHSLLSSFFLLQAPFHILTLSLLCYSLTPSPLLRLFLSLITYSFIHLLFSLPPYAGSVRVCDSPNCQVEKNRYLHF